MNEALQEIEKILEVVEQDSKGIEYCELNYPESDRDHMCEMTIGVKDQAVALDTLKEVKQESGADKVLVYLTPNEKRVLLEIYLLFTREVSL